ncbi:methionine aminotransferase [Parasediminibacterium sp. JCM 36343]|uniref:methionine aminotransferase n=1 Tax=Parasediminibacterium sp. JCM 36343 TaxID=3374279 RepID=UPI00397AA399
MISKLPNVGTTIFTTMSALAAKHKAINLGQGFPDYPMDEQLTALVTKAMQDNYNQYMPMAGYAPLLEAIAAKVQKLYGTTVNPQQQITITPGGTYAIYSAITAMINKGDEVIVFEPAYDSYIPNIEVNAGKAVRLQLLHPTYSIDWAAVKQAITPKTRMIIINSPHNPSGAVLSADDIQQLRRVVAGTDICIVSDEVYEHLIYDNLPHESILKYPDLLERAFVCFSFGKVYNCTGWKVGYCIAPEAFTKEFRKVHQFNCFSVNSPMQVALAEHLQDEQAYLQLAPQLQRKRDYFRELMAATPLKVVPSHGSYFELYSYGGISNETESNLATRLVTECGVATIPTSAFYKDAIDNKVLRFCFAKKEATLEEAVEGLKGFEWEIGNK